MTEKIYKYLETIDRVYDNYPKLEKATKDELVKVSYGLITSKNIIKDIQYLDFLIDMLWKNKIISNNLYLDLGGRLNDIIQEHLQIN